MSNELMPLSLYNVLLTDVVEHEEGEPETRGVEDEVLSTGVSGATS